MGITITNHRGDIYVPRHVIVYFISIIKTQHSTHVVHDGYGVLPASGSIINSSVGSVMA